MDVGKSLNPTQKPKFLRIHSVPVTPINQHQISFDQPDTRRKIIEYSSGRSVSIMQIEVGNKICENNRVMTPQFG